MTPTTTVTASASVSDLRGAHRIKRKPPPIIPISERYPSPDPSDPFAPLSVLRKRTSSALNGLPFSSQETLQHTIVERSRSNSLVYSPISTQASTIVNTSVSPSRSSTPSPRSITKGHYRPHSQSNFISSIHAFPRISSPPLASQTDLSYHHSEPWPTNYVHYEVRQRAAPVIDMHDSSETESDGASIPIPSLKVKSRFIFQPRRANSDGTRFPRFLLRRKDSMVRPPGAGTASTGSSAQSSVTEFRRVHKSSISTPVISCVPWESNITSVGRCPAPIISEPMDTDVDPTVTNAVDTVDPRVRAKASVTDIRHQPDAESDKYDPKQEPSRKLKRTTHPEHPPPRIFRKRKSSMGPFSPISPSPRSTSTASSYVNISCPSPAPSFSHHTSADAYISPRPAPRPPPTPFLGLSKPKSKSQKDCEKSCGNDRSHSTPAEWDAPTPAQLYHAAELQITGEDGTRITFGSLFENQRTIVIFIRHFWCPLCQDYMSSVKSYVRAEMLHAASPGSEEIQFVVISNGAYGMIAKYRQIFGLPFQVYTDPTLAIYSTLGMGRDGDDKQQHLHAREGLTEKGDASDIASRDGGYVKHGLMGGIAMVVVRAIKVGMPVWEKGGDIGQLGGEFIFGPGLTCSYAHRMQTTKGHAPIQDVLQAAGISAPIPEPPQHRAKLELAQAADWNKYPSLSQGGPRKRRSSMKTLRETLSTRRNSRRNSVGQSTMTREEEEQWMAHRQQSIERLQERKDMRRGMTIRRSSSSQTTGTVLEPVGELSERPSSREDSDQSPETTRSSTPAEAGDR